MNLSAPSLKLAILSGSAGLALFLGGCSSMTLDHSGEMVAVYQFGEFKMLLNANATASAKAVEQTLSEFDLYQTASEVNRHDAKITARNRADQLINFDIQEVNAMQTLIRIHWGAGGDKGLSRRFFDSVDAKLSK